MAFDSAFDSIVGQIQAIALLKAAIKYDRIAPAYLFTGANGIGRSLTALAFAQTLIQNTGLHAASNAHKSSQRVSDRNHPDVLWVEPTYLDKGKMLTAKEAEEAGLKRRASPQVRLEQIRDITDFLSHAPLESKRSVVIVQEAQTMAEAAANGLLKTLEEPGRATIILIVPDASAILPTLVSRCQRIPFYRLDRASLLEVLSRVGYAEIPEQIVALAQGSPGEAIAAYEQFQAIPPQILATTESLPPDAKTAMAIAKQITKDLDVESQLWLIDYLQNHYWRSQGRSQVVKSLEEAKHLLAGYVQPRLVWEVTLLQMAGKLQGI
ncbi:DNA polymerase III subunit delta' [Tumidithrix elongata RA019]|uniref:DNA polymerase III subunit delta n=1 Tax=Tumidithrix elongata BACA0141 TaxID=2716417 RepID=A0AAW9PU22_9CYAN|nr:DNA polymerase III subunit delta' [Tumidithrix elongata RA019]